MSKAIKVQLCNEATRADETFVKAVNINIVTKSKIICKLWSYYKRLRHLFKHSATARMVCKKNKTDKIGPNYSVLSRCFLMMKRRESPAL